MVQPILVISSRLTQLVVRYDIAGGLRIGLLHSSYDFTDAGNAAQNDNGSATRLEVRVDF